MENIEKSNSSSFEDLSNLNENDLKDMSAGTADPDTTTTTKTDDILDIIGNGQLTKKVHICLLFFSVWLNVHCAMSFLWLYFIGFGEREW